VKRGLKHYVEHLADIAVLGGNRRQLDCAAAGGVVRHEPERVECRALVLLLLPLLRPISILAARRDCDAPASRSHSAPQRATRSRGEGATARGEGNAAAPGSGSCGNRGEEEQGSGGGGGRAGTAAGHGGGR
jgi:hypothetical protein